MILVCYYRMCTSSILLFVVIAYTKNTMSNSSCIPYIMNGFSSYWRNLQYRMSELCSDTKVHDVVELKTISIVAERVDENEYTGLGRNLQRKTWNGKLVE